MCIYCGTNKYRKIYENHYGPIPKDETGRTYDIHHIDGNRKNNSPENLKALSIQDHYTAHYEQSDWAACLRIASKMKVSPEELSVIASKNASVVNRKQWDSLGKDHPLIKNNKDRVDNGTHNFLGGHINKQRIDEGTHNFLQSWTCIHCNKVGKNINLFKRWGHDTGECLKPREFIPKSADQKQYKWFNVKTNEFVNMTRTELKRSYNLNSRDIYRVVKGSIKSTKGWTLVS